MRNLSLLGPLSFGLSFSMSVSGCGSAAVEQPGPPPVDPRLYLDAGPRTAVHARTKEEIQAAERESVAAILAGYAEDDFKTALPRLDPEGNLSFPGLSEATDRDGDVKALGELFGAFSGRRFLAGRSWLAANAVITEWTMTGTHHHAWMGLAATERPVTIRGLGLFWFDTKGLVSDTHLFFDVGATLVALGGVAPKGVEAPAVVPSETTVVAATGAEAERQNLAIVNASWDALEAKSEAGYLAPFTDETDLVRLDRAAPEHGKADRRKYFKWATTGIGSLAQTPLNAWGVGSFVIEEYSLTGVHSGKLTDAPASGHALRLHFVDVDELRDGKVVRTWTYGNSLELYAQTGQVERAAPGAASAVIR